MIGIDTMPHYLNFSAVNPTTFRGWCDEIRDPALREAKTPGHTAMSVPQGDGDLFQTQDRAGQRGKKWLHMCEATHIRFISQENVEIPVKSPESLDFAGAFFFTQRVNGNVFRQIEFSRPHRHYIDLVKVGAERVKPGAGESQQRVLGIRSEVE